MKDTLPDAPSVLVVCAHPDDESFGLGAVLAAFAEAGTRLSVLCFTHGEASTLHGRSGDLHEVRAKELEAAGEVLGVDYVELLDYPDGGLAGHPLDELRQHVTRIATTTNTTLLLVFDEGGITGHPDHRHATAAAMDAGLPVLAWAIPDHVAITLNTEFATTFAGRPIAELDIAVLVDRTRQRGAIACHLSQSAHNPVLWRRLELLGDTEYLRYLTATPLNM